MNHFNYYIKRYLLFCVFNTLVAVCVFFLLQKSHLLPGDKSSLFYLGPEIKSLFASEKKNIPVDNILFINTHHYKVRIPNYDSIQGHRIENGTTSAVDLTLLIKLYSRLLETNAYDFVACNVLLDYPSMHHDSLANIIRQMRNTAISRYTGAEALASSYQNLDLADASIYAPGGRVSKYRLFEMEDGNVYKSFPLTIQEAISGSEIDPGFIFSKLGKSYIFNDFTLEQFGNRKDFNSEDLGNIVDYGLVAFKERTAGKIIIIDDLEDNLVNTIYGNDIPMAVVLANTYLSIANDSIVIKWSFLILLIIVCFFFSYLVIIPQNKFYRTLLNQRYWGILRGGFWYIPTFAIIALFIYFIFGNNLNLAYLGIFFYIENLVIHRKYHFKRIKRRINLK